jgi:predicted phosphoadenosine phosphosulfate sulfurtransferase
LGKIYTEKDVLTAALQRLEIMFDNFKHMYFSVSGGKDSSVMLQLAAQVARKRGRTFDVLYIDLEAQYKATIEHIEELREQNKDVIHCFYWVCLPLSLRNAVSVIQPKWVCWDEENKKKWVRSLPKNKDVFHIKNYPDEWKWFKSGMEFEEFILYFAEWYSHKHGIAAAGIGIRSDESLNRFATITSDRKERFKDYGWTTLVRLGVRPIDVYNFYPIYDWRTEDIWGAVSLLNLSYNRVYELMYKNGLSIHEQRLCQPYGDDQRNGLDQFRYIEPETWEKVLNRVHGVNFGNIYARTSLLGNIKSEKPNSMTWEQYAVFLLESLGLYAPELRDHYYRKIKTFLDWYEKQEGVSLQEIEDEADSKLESSKKVASWRRIARAIEKNDFWMKRLSFSQTKRDVEKLHELKNKYRNIIFAKDTDDKHLKQVAEQLNDGEIKMKYEIFQGDYDRSKFYSLMGKFFAEKEFRKVFPYLSNEDGRVWIVATEEDEVLGFTTFLNRRRYMDLGYTFGVNSKLRKELMEQRFAIVEEKYAHSPLKSALQNKEELPYWLDKGFVVEKETKNYYFVVKEKKNES